MSGGGRFLSSIQAFLEGCKKCKICYNSDMLHHKYNGDCMKNRKYAFTLAEVLVTLGIIGVVSAMTVPSLMQNYQRQSYVTQLHKVYNELSQALVQYQNDKNALNLKEAGLTNQAAIENFVEKYFKVVNDCGATKTPCFASQYKKLTGTAVATWNPKAHYVISSGASIGVGEVLTGDTLFRVYVDINGQKGPNIWGRDIFIMYIYKNGLLDDSTLSATSTAPMTEADRTSMFNTSCNTSTTSIHGCFGKILNDNWEMTY